MQKQRYFNLQERIDALVAHIKSNGLDTPQGIQEADKPEKAELIADKAECIRFLGESITSGRTRDLVAEIDLLFSSTQGVTLATVHKAKGMESRRVFILDQHLMPSRYAKTPEALQQEHNLIYVAITRAKHTLTYITGSTFKE